MTDKYRKKKKVPLIGMLALKNQLVTKAELEVALTQCQGSKNIEAALKNYFLSKELISEKNIKRLTLAAKAVSIRQKEYTFGAVAMAKGFINKSVLDLALEEQQADLKTRQKPRLIGDMMVEAGLLTIKQRDYILKLQNRYRKAASQALAGDQASEKSFGKTELPETEALADPAVSNQDEADNENSTPKEGTAPQEAEEPTLLEPEMLTGGVQLQVSSDFMSAFLSKSPEFDEDVLAFDLRDELFDRGIISGVVADDLIDGFIRSSGFKTQAFRVAKGIRAIQGQDAKVEFFFNIDYLKAGGMGEDGTIDFKERGHIPLVEKGTVLAEKTPKVEARWGQNIYGDEVETVKGEDKALKFGKGAVLSEDGLKILAGLRGYPKYSLAGVIFVHDEYITSGDVDFETGHIEFDGNVNVKGCIKSGFKVRGNDIATVELDGGSVEADGDLKVVGGINEGHVYARGNVYAKFIHNSTIVCMGDVFVQKEIVDSAIESSGACSIVNGKLISSKVSAKMGFSAKNIGTEMASASYIKVGHDAFTQKELKINKVNVAKIKEKILGLEERKSQITQENAELQKEITKLAHIQDRTQLEQREMEEKLKDPAHSDEVDQIKPRLAELGVKVEEAEKNLDLCFEKSEAFDKLIEQVTRNILKLKKSRDILVEEKNNLVKWSKGNPGKSVVAVDGVIMAGTVISGKHSEYTVDKMIRHAKISEVLFKSDDSGEERTTYQMNVGSF
ncbi:MAG: DUF342 domain-containing protein [Desulfobacter sp.]|nr:DUF342 domain-containing protein [Desulfobacter sp.]WDP85234.1 MAG: DUF342 domain-containing protein [Desulfobacter sp.]